MLVKNRHFTFKRIFSKRSFLKISAQIVNHNLEDITAHNKFALFRPGTVFLKELDLKVLSTKILAA